MNKRNKKYKTNSYEKQDSKFKIKLARREIE